MKGALGDMMKKAQEMQENMQKAQRELAEQGSHRRSRWWHGVGGHARYSRSQSRHD